jgi:nitrogen-specific signal transduction histidine kinase
LEIDNIDLNAVLKKSMEIATMENSYKVETNFWQNGIRIQGDSAKLQNCFLNIIQAMIDILASEEDQINIETKLIATEKDCIRGLRRKCKAALPECRYHGCVSVKISVENGYISQESLEQLFNPFDSSKDKQARIRLPISKKIINLHKGNIAISSQKGQGTIAQIVLPMEHSENTDKEYDG